MKNILVIIALVLFAVSPVFAGSPLQTSTSTAVAGPSFSNGGSAWGNPDDGGWGVGSAGIIGVTSYAQGTKSANTTAFATGKAFGFGGAVGIQTPHFGFGVSGALSGIYLTGAGYGLGVDKLSFFNNPDFASVGISYEGEVGQGNGILVSNGSGTFAGGRNETGAMFMGGSYTSSNGKVLGIDFLFPALAVGEASVQRDPKQPRETRGACDSPETVGDSRGIRRPLRDLGHRRGGGRNDQGPSIPLSGRCAARRDKDCSSSG